MMFRHLLNDRTREVKRRDFAQREILPHPSRMGVVLSILSMFLLTTSCGGRQPEAEHLEAVSGVAVETVQLQMLDDTYEAVGTVRAKTSSVVSARILGTITRFLVREGDHVRIGQLLVEIDDRDAASQVRKAEAGQQEALDALEEVGRSIRAAQAGKSAAEANKALAAATFTRYQTLLERRSVSPQEFDEAQAKFRAAAAETERANEMYEALLARQKQVQARIEQASAEVSAARVLLGYSQITSPISGVVTSKSADVGYMATPGAPLLGVDDNSSYRLEVSVEESQLANIHQGDKAEVHIDAAGGVTTEGRVAEIAPEADPRSRSYVVKVALPAASGKEIGQAVYRSGQYGKAQFITGKRQVMSMPAAALVRKGQLTSVYVIDHEGIAHLRLVKSGKTFGDSLEILSGLDAGERVAANNISALRDGVRVLPPSASGR